MSTNLYDRSNFKAHITYEAIFYDGNKSYLTCQVYFMQTVLRVEFIKEKQDGLCVALIVILCLEKLPRI